jgi:hypothetical protein
VCVPDNLRDFFSEHDVLNPLTCKPDERESCLEDFLEENEIIVEGCPPGYYNELASLMHVPSHG